MRMGDWSSDVCSSDLEIDTRGAFEEDRHPARRARYAPARNRRREQARQTDHRPGIALQRITQGQKPDGVHPTQYFADREIAVNYRISKRRPRKGAAAILYRIKSYGTLIRIPPSTKIRNIFLLGKIDTINRRFVKNSVNYRFFSNSSINPFGARQGRRVSRWMKPRTVEPVLSSSPASL